MSTDSLTPAGSAQYDSETMFVGDGTWDSTSNTFLLPNLQGLNYATTRYNGMGARFAALPGYYNLVVAHGVLAAITFLFIVPFAIMINRFYSQSPYWKLRLHIWAQVLTVFLTTVIFTLGWFQVGPRRSLTNPHHSIGLALYVLILVQFIGGYLNYKATRRRKYTQRPLRIVLHQWIGRVIGLLGIIQVALGLTLYGSPLSLFILYAITVFILVLAYFILDFQRGQELRSGESHTSYGVGTETVQTEKPGRRFGLGKTLLAGGALGALAGRWRNRRRSSGSDWGSEEYSEYESQTQSGRPSHRPSHRPGQSQISEKHSEHVDKSKDHTWRNRLLGLGALGGLGYWLKRRRDRADEPESTADYASYDSESSGGQTMSRMEAAEEGRPHTPHRPAASAATTPGSQERLTKPSHARTHSSMSDESSYLSSSPSKYRPRRGVRDGLLGLGFLGAAKGMFDFKKRRERKEQLRIEELRRQEMENEYVQRRRSKKFTGDGRPSRRDSYASTAQTADPRNRIGSGKHSVAPSAALGASTIGPLSMPGPSGAPGTSTNVMSGAIPDNSTQASLPAGSGLPPPPPVHNTSGTYSPSGSRPSTAFPGRSEGHISAADTTAAGLAGAAGGAVLGAGLASGRHSRDESRSRRSHSQARVSEQSPATPVSVKLNVHPDGRHVTLRRLTEEEAAKDRENKRTRNRSRRRRAGSGNESALSDTESGRWRRTDQRDSPSRPAQPPQAGTPNPPASALPPFAPSTPLPPSSAVPYTQSQGIMSNQSLMPPGSVSTIQGQRRPSQSPAGILSNAGSAMSPPGIPESQGSQMSNYEENRRRRRAERARERAGRQVEFE